MPLSISYFGGARGDVLDGHIAGELVEYADETTSAPTPDNAGVAVLVSDAAVRVQYGSAVTPTSMPLLPNVQYRVKARWSVTWNVLGADGLFALALSNDTVQDDAEASDIVGAVLNLTPGSALTITDDAGGLFDVDGGNVIVDDTLTAGEYEITLRETDGGASNSPRDTVLTITVTEAPEEE